MNKLKIARKYGIKKYSIEMKVLTVKKPLFQHERLLTFRRTRSIYEILEICLTDFC